MTDTIFAPATAAGRSAVAVVRLSGPGAGAAVKALAGKLPRPRAATLRVLRDGQGRAIDQALVLWFEGPSSYTGEDAAEFHVHGGPAVVAGLLEALNQLDMDDLKPYLAATAAAQKLINPAEMGELFKVIAFSKGFVPSGLLTGFQAGDDSPKL